MVRITVKENESVDRALKRFKKKFERAGVIRELRDRKQFTKPSVEKKKQKERAAYKQKMYGAHNY